MKTALYEKQLITTRDLLRHFAAIVRTPKSRRYIIINHGKPVATLIPHQRSTSDSDWWKSLSDHVPVEEPKKYLTLQELRAKYSFHSGEQNLSQHIDEIVYGVKR